MIAHKYDDAHPLIVDGASSWILSDDLTIRNCDEFAVAKTADVYGATFYPKSWGNNYKDCPWELSLYYAIPASAAQKTGRPYFVNELQTHTQSVLTPGSEVTTDELKQWIMMCIFTGAQAMQLWRWRPFLHGYQATGRGLTQINGKPNARSLATKELLAVINKHSEIFVHAKPRHSQVQIAYSYQSRLYFDALLKWKGSYWKKEIEGWNKLFWNLDYS